LNLGTSESVVGWSKRTALFTFSFCFPLLHFCKKADGTTSEAVEKPRKEKQLLHDGTAHRHGLFYVEREVGAD
jgi:hypothetical protein